MKKFLFGCTTLLIVVVALELLSGVGLLVLGSRADAPTEERAATDVAVQILHPYLGFVLNPEDSNTETYGFSPFEPGYIRSEDDARAFVAVTGGSVAQQFAQSTDGVAALKQHLRTFEAFDGREIVIVPLAVPGYKQPQQFSALAYMLTLGATFDMVINLDGLNDIALPIHDNEKNNIALHYPRGWYWRVTRLPDADLARAVGRLTLLQDIERFLARGTLSMRLAAILLEQHIDYRRVAIEAQTPAADSYLTRGPAKKYESTDDALEAAATIWAAGSQQMRVLSEGNKIAYFHVLQPNQYVAATKELLEGEYRDNHPYKPLVAAGYPMLRAHAEALQLIDLSGLFVGSTERLYSDDCCHLTERGNELLGAAIGAAILKRNNE